MVSKNYMNLSKLTEWELSEAVVAIGTVETNGLIVA
jgi:hypothetical protein